MDEQQAGRERRLSAFPAGRDDRPARAMRVVVDFADFVFCQSMSRIGWPTRAPSGTRSVSIQAMISSPRLAVLRCRLRAIAALYRHFPPRGRGTPTCEKILPLRQTGGALMNLR
jgi:hypothetical protein